MDINLVSEKSDSQIISLLIVYFDSYSVYMIIAILMGVRCYLTVVLIRIC